jgi:cytochrome c peroxidase
LEEKMGKHLLLLVCLLLLACQSQETVDESASAGAAQAGGAGGLFAVLPSVPPQLDENEITAEKVVLGKMLYFEPRLSRSWLISCNTCHNLGLAGVDLVETSIGHGWQKGPRNAPTVLNAVFNTSQFWDGRAEDLMEQAMGPVQAAVEMNSTPDRVVATLSSMPEYVERFRAAFPGEPNPVSFENMARAIEAFEATLITPDSPFDRHIEGDASALTGEQLEGLELFTARGCAACHSGVNLGGSAFFKFGVVRTPDAAVLPPGDKGRFAVTDSESDEYMFRTPTLRNVAVTPPYFHSGTVWDLGQAVSIMGSAQLGADLDAGDTEKLVAFLEALTGRQPKVEYPTLPPHTKDTPLPDVSAAVGGH